MYVAIIGDIVDSKKIPEEKRRDIQKKLKKTLDTINKQYHKNLASNFTITLGDEFQGLLKTPERIFEMLDTIELAMAEEQIEIRFGIGLGEITTKIDPALSIGADGPAYWHARTAIEYIHDEDDYGLNHIAFYYPDHPDVGLINAAIGMTEYTKNKWTTTQIAVLSALIQTDNYNDNFKQVTVAEKMGLHPNAFFKRVATSGIKIYLRNRKEIERKIARLAHDSH